MLAGYCIRAPLICGLAFLVAAALSGLAYSADTETPALELRTALARTLEHSPVLDIFPYRERAADARILQAGLRPNPELSIEVENFAGSGSFSGTDSAQVTLALSQTIELGGKREERTLLAEMNRELIGVDYDVARLDVLAEAARRFIHVARDQSLLDLARRRNRLAIRALRVAEQRVESGRSSPVEASQARIERARAGVDEEHAEHELASARVRLAASWGEMDPDFPRVNAALFQFPEVPRFDTLRAQLDRAPALERYLTVERVRAAAVRLAEARGRQDARVGLGVRHLEDTGDRALMLQFTMPLPFPDRNQGNAAAARAERQMTNAERRQTRIAIYAALFELYQELQHAHTEATVLHDVALPEAEQVMEQFQTGYQAGRFSYLELVEGRRQRLGVEHAAIEAAAEFHTLLLELERLTGQPLVVSQQSAGPDAGE
jgi:cobalt-zinc-cadmium efflux system outer membrane protein